MNDLQGGSETRIIKLVQKASFAEEIKILSSRGNVNSDQHKVVNASSYLFNLDPFLDEQGILRVGGRIRHRTLDLPIKHRVILPKASHITELIVRYFHQQTDYQGRGITMNEIRSDGFCVVGCDSMVSKLIHKCVVCRKIRSQAHCPKMADLPADRLEPAPPFSYCAVDFFGPFHIREGGKKPSV